MKHLEAIFDHINTGILVLDADARIHFSNQWMQVYHGAKLPVGACINEVFEMTTQEFQKLQRKIQIVLTLNTPAFVSAEHDHFLLPMHNTRIVNPMFEQMQQDVSLVPFGEEGHLVLVMIYDQTALMISKEEIKAQASVLSASLQDMLKAHNRLVAQTEVIERQANYDALTGLPNRTLLKDRVFNAMNLAQQTGDKIALLYVDLDRFKPINDNFGQKVGDELLVQIARGLEKLVAKTDTVARLASDEFAILLTRVQEMDRVALLAESVLSAIAAPWSLTHQTLFISASIGISVFPGDASDYESLVSYADLAMEKAKKDPKTGYCFYTEGLNEALKESLLLEAELKKAIAEQALEIYFQPKYRTDLPGEPKLYGAEALVRWIHPELGWVGPDKFIPIAERMGVITDLTEWMLTQTCRLQQVFLAKGLSMPISVNISPMDLADEGFCTKVCELVSAFQVPENLIELEITERMAISERATGYERLKFLRSQGFLISLDDFGTGYSSLSYLAEMPVDILKIDKSFIDQYGQSDKQSAILRNIIQLAEVFEMKPIAEGVETKEMVAVLSGFKCHFFQGYYFSKPLPKKEFEALCLNQIY